MYFHGNCAFSLPSFMTYRASLWDTIRLLHLPPFIESDARLTLPQRKDTPR
ncbi:MAG: hypothetical protein BECKG1743D_GA0114223_107091 [Candidatus Kentron sp. G]|nr:MAG: hypothetical protein BECKG1743D_GA0114223_107091 [Candidatus Kentron sp. G]